MTLNKNFVLRQVADTWVVLPLGEATLDFHGMLTLNESGAMLWNKIECGCNPDELAEVLTAEYNVSYSQALADVNEFIDKLAKAGCVG